jgi:hypothetical protein
MTLSTRLTVLCLAGGLSLLAPGADAADERLCLLKRIEATKSGVNLYFTAARQVMLMHDQEGDLYMIDAAARETEGSATTPKTMHSLPLRAGEEAVLRTTADERCSITLSQRNGKVGVEVELSGSGWEGKRSAPAGTAAGASASAPKSTNPRFGKFLPAEP